ncbi:uncharacterized protein E6C27_scaffold57G002840 [Cucumis melo var. makuwa]|uniref:Gag-pol polyprotein n=1 Tax=Cucumis melo var. makuwa TaxID=1194695 RepID=A0A5A7SVB2_CUCMM|nr:uncharacterized protein E6C27_scaffold57G002840 [Cucumis melo var. makuwa]
MSKDESVAEYNERVLEIANGSFNLGEKISESKIVRKMLLSLPGKIDMKVTAIEEAHDITKLKLDELFGSLLTFEMTISNRENKKGTGVASKSVYEEESTDNKSPSVANVNEFIALLTKQFSKVVKKFKNMNTTGSNSRNSINFRRRDDEDTDDSEENDGGTNAFIVNITKTDSVTEDESENSKEESDNELSFKQLKIQWKKDSKVRAIQNEKIQGLLDENERLLSIISSLKLKLREIQTKYDQTM